jgi:hypothetical protein
VAGIARGAADNQMLSLEVLRDGSTSGHVLRVVHVLHGALPSRPTRKNMRLETPIRGAVTMPRSYARQHAKDCHVATHKNRA